MQENYNRVQEEEITDMIQEVELAHHTHQHKLSWQLTNNLTERKNAKKGTIKGNNKQDRTSSTLRTYLERNQLSHIQMKKSERSSTTLIFHN